MDKVALGKIAFISTLLGAVCAVLAIIPVVVKFVTFVLMTCICVPIIFYLRKLEKLEIFTIKESLCAGAVSGFVSFMVFTLIFIPLVNVISLFFPITYLGGLVLMLKLSNFWLILMFALFVSTVSVIFNAFSSLLYYYASSTFETVQKDKTFKLK